MDIHIPPDLEARLAHSAEASGRRVDELAVELLNRTLEHDAWFRAEVEIGRADALLGTFEHAEVTARLARRYPR